MFEDSFNIFMLADEFNSSLWSNAFDGITIVTPQKYAKVDELKIEDCQWYIQILTFVDMLKSKNNQISRQLTESPLTSFLKVRILHNSHKAWR